MKRLASAFCAMMLLGFSNVVSANDAAKVGVVDLQKIMQTSSQMKAIQQKLEKEFKPRRDKLIAMEQNVKNDMEKFKRDSAVMNETQKKEAERKIIAAKQLFERQGQQYQQELSTAHNEAMEDLYAKIRASIQAVAQKGHYDLVLQKDAAPFSSNKLDITADVIKEIH